METIDHTGPATTAPDTADVVARCADLVAERFVLPDVGERAAARLRERAAAGAYDDLDPAALAAALSADLQDVAHDLHLRVIHHPEGVPPTEDPAAYEAYWREMARTTAGGMRRVERLAGNVAHLSIGPVLAPAGASWDAVAAAMALVADADALVLDVRECRGGDPDSVQLLLSHVVGDEPVRLVDIESRAEGVHQRWTHPVAARRFGPDRPLVVLTSATTFSGGRSWPSTCSCWVAAGSWGSAPVAGPTRARASPCTPSSSSPSRWPGHCTPRDGSSWEGVGVQPDVECPAGEALDRALALLRGA